MVEERERLTKKVKDKKILISMLGAFASLIVLLIISFASNVPLFPGIELKKQNSSVKEMESRLNQIEADIVDIKKSLSVNQSPSYNYLSSRIGTIEQKNQYLYDTILKDPNTAITPIILEKEQVNINQRITDLRVQVDKTNTWLLGIFGTLLVSLLISIGKLMWESFNPKKNIIKE